MGNVYCGSSKYSIYIRDGKVRVYKYGRLLVSPLSFYLFYEDKKINLFEGWEKEAQDLFYVKGKGSEGESIVQMSDKGIVMRFYINNTLPFKIRGIKIEGKESDDESNVERDDIRGVFVLEKGIIGVMEDANLDTKEGLVIKRDIDPGGKEKITVVISASKDEYDALMSSVRGKELREVYNLVDKDFLTLYTYFFDNFDIKTSNYDLQDLVNMVKNNIMLNVKRIENNLVFVSSPFKFTIDVPSLLFSLPHLFHLNDHDVIKNTIDFLISYFDKNEAKLPSRLIIDEGGEVKEIAYDDEYNFYLLSRFLTVVNEYVERTGNIEYGDKIHYMVERMEEEISKKVEKIYKEEGINKYDFYGVLALTTYYKDRKLYRSLMHIIDKHIDYVTHSFKEEHIPIDREELASVLGILSLSSLSKIITQNFVKELRKDVKNEDMKRLIDFFSLDGRTIEEMDVLISRIIRMVMENPNLIMNSFVFDVLINKIMELDVREIKSSINVKLKNIMNKGKIAIYNMNYQGISLSMLYDFTSKRMKVDCDVKDKRYGLRLEMPFDSEVIVNGKKVDKGRKVYVEVI